MQTLVLFLTFKIQNGWAYISKLISFRELKIANEWFSEGPGNQMSYRWAENVDRALLQMTDEPPIYESIYESFKCW